MLLEYADDFVNRFLRGEDSLGLCARFTSIRNLMIWCYQVYVRLNVVPSLEDLGPEDKQLIWEQTKPYREGLTREQLIDLSRIIYLISITAHQKTTP